MWDATVPAQKVLSAVVRTGQRFGAGHVIDVLLGKRTEKVLSWQHDELPTFGVGADLAEREWRSIIRQLVARSVLSPDPSRMGALTITEAARPILDGVQTVELRRLAAAPTRSRSSSRSAGASGAAAAGAGASAADQALFEVLRTERRSIADAEGVPAYVVLPDRTLWELVAAKPQHPRRAARGQRHRAGQGRRSTARPSSRCSPPGERVGAASARVRSRRRGRCRVRRRTSRSGAAQSA